MLTIDEIMDSLTPEERYAIGHPKGRPVISKLSIEEREELCRLEQLKVEWNLRNWDGLREFNSRDISDFKLD